VLPPLVARKGDGGLRCVARWTRSESGGCGCDRMDGEVVHGFGYEAKNGGALGVSFFVWRREAATASVGPSASTTWRAEG